MRIYYDPLSYTSFMDKEQIKKFYDKLSDLKVKIYFDGEKTGRSKDYVDWFEIPKIKGYEHLIGHSIDANSSIIYLLIKRYRRLL